MSSLAISTIALSSSSVPTALPEPSSDASSFDAIISVVSHVKRSPQVATTPSSLPSNPTSTLTSSYLKPTNSVGVGLSSHTSHGYPAAYSCDYKCGIGVGVGITVGILVVLCIWTCYWYRRPYRPTSAQHVEADRMRLRLLAGDAVVTETFQNILRQPSVQMKRLSQKLSKLSPRTPTFNLNNRHDQGLEEDEIPLAGLRAITQAESTQSLSSANEICRSPTWDRKGKNKPLPVPGPGLAAAGNSMKRPPNTAHNNDQEALGRAPGRSVTRFGASVDYGGRGMPRAGLSRATPRAPEYAEYIPAPEQMYVMEGESGPSGLKRVYK